MSVYTVSDSPVTVGTLPVVVCDITNGNVTANLPQASTCSGKVVQVRALGNGGVVKIAAYSGDSIQAADSSHFATSLNLWSGASASGGSSVSLVSDGVSKWTVAPTGAATKSVAYADTPAAIGDANTAIVNIVSGDVELYLPLASSCSGRIVQVKAINSGHNCIITAAGSDTIQTTSENSYTGILTLTPGSGATTDINAATLVSDGVSKWLILATVFNHS